MTNLSHVFNSVSQPATNVRERIRSKAHWSLIILLLIVCFLIALGGDVFHHTFGHPSLTLQDISTIIVYDITGATFVPLILCVFWMVQYLVIHLFHGKGSCLTHGWVDLVCATPCIIALTGIWYLPSNTLWTVILYLFVLSGILCMFLLNIWMISKIHNVHWGMALASTVLACLAIPVAFMLIVVVYFLFGIIDFPHPS